MVSPVPGDGAPHTIDDLATTIETWRQNGLGAFDSVSAWLPMNTSAITAAYTMTGRDRIILADATGGAFAVTLPQASLHKNQQPLVIKRLNSGGNAVTVGSSGGTIDGAATQSLGAQYASITVVSDGTNWLKIA